MAGVWVRCRQGFGCNVFSSYSQCSYPFLCAVPEVLYCCICFVWLTHNCIVEVVTWWGEGFDIWVWNNWCFWLLEICQKLFALIWWLLLRWWGASWLNLAGSWTPHSLLVGWGTKSEKKVKLMGWDSLKTEKEDTIMIKGYTKQVIHKAIVHHPLSHGQWVSQQQLALPWQLPTVYILGIICTEISLGSAVLAVAPPSFLCSQSSSLAGCYEKLRSPWISLSAAQQQVNHQGFVNIILTLNPKHCTSYLEGNYPNSSQIREEVFCFLSTLRTELWGLVWFSFSPFIGNIVWAPNLLSNEDDSLQACNLYFCNC